MAVVLYQLGGLEPQLPLLLLLLLPPAQLVVLIEVL